MIQQGIRVMLNPALFLIIYNNKKIMKIDKQKLFNILKERIEKEIIIIEKAFNSALKDFREAPGVMQSASDTTRSEQDRMQATYQQKLNELKKGFLDLEKLILVDSSVIKEGSLIVCENNDNQEIYWIVNVGAGERIEINNKEIKTISSDSPLAQVLLGQKEGNVVELKLGGNIEIKKLKIIEVK